jgi:hypothetical protein
MFSLFISAEFLCIYTVLRAVGRSVLYCIVHLYMFTWCRAVYCTCVHVYLVQSLQCTVHVYMFTWRRVYSVLYMCTCLPGTECTVYCTCVHVYLLQSYSVLDMCTCSPGTEGTMYCTCVHVYLVQSVQCTVHVHMFTWYRVYMCTCLPGTECTINCTCVHVYLVQSVQCNVHVYMFTWNRVMSSCSVMVRGTCPTNIFMASGSGS